MTLVSVKESQISCFRGFPKFGLFQNFVIWWKSKDPSQKASKPCSASKTNHGFIARDIRLVKRRLLVAEEQVLLEFRAQNFLPLKNSALRHREFLLKELVDFTKSVVPNVKDPLSNEAKPLKNYFQSG